MDLAHPRFGDTEHAPDLRQRQRLVVVEREDDLLALGHAVDGLAEHLAHLGHLEGARRAVAGVGDRVAERERLATITADEEDLVERCHTHHRDLAEDLLELRLGPTEFGGDLFVGGRPALASFELGERLLHRPDLGANRAGHPVDAAQLVEDGALDTADGVGLELEATVGLELVDGVDQAEHAVAHEVRVLDVLGKADRDAARDVLDQR